MRLFQALPQVDVIDLTVLEHNSESVINGWDSVSFSSGTRCRAVSWHAAA
jgi:hypothetical protein